MKVTYTQEDRVRFALMCIQSILEALQEEPDLGYPTQTNVESWLATILDEADVTPYKGLITAMLSKGAN